MLSVMVAGLLTVAAPDKGPWYARSACEEGVALVYGGDLATARARAESMATSEDVDERACGLWLPVSMAEMELAIEGDDQAVHRKQGRRLEALEAFARDHRGEGARFADLLLEVQLRRVRLFIAQDRRADAVSEARAAQRTLEVRRGRRAVTPTFLYAEAVQNLALAGADWPVQLVLRMAGLRADGARGARALKVLLAKDSAYGLEVRYLARTFAVSPDADTKGPLAYSAELHRRFPANPQLAFDHAVDLLEAKKPAEAAAALAEPLARLTAQPDTWSARIRAKLYWAAGRAALDEGKRHEAERLAERAAREAPPDVRDRVRSLKEALAR